MRRHNPDHQRDIPISMAVHWQLVGASIRTGFQKEDWEIAAEAIDEWVRRNDPEGVPMPAHKGYQWKSLFLPDGTVLRTVFEGKNHHCVVESDQILYNGQAVSPSGFVNAVGGIRRNAWRSTWILFPDARQWQLADALRPRKQPRRVRKAPPENMQPNPAVPRHPADTLATAADAAIRPLTVHQAAAPEKSCEELCVPSEPDDQVEADCQSTATSVSGPRCARGADRRGGAPARLSPAWLSPVLRDELLRLLGRTDGAGERRRESGARTTGRRPSG